eukprot:CAMPEP_0184491726 /NCGR_PEP_ID=MMETSP0113_2-20130426/21213_1 /TAXON_ID=91329 /ORGANISM="Norrisiella sphaerica, Strain BC52" /LENGTH=119 /DNA_ID=CAMNT_0026876211 /DNA_START=8 /DNA_END=367 /DNA_ORIENTATION=-
MEIENSGSYSDFKQGNYGMHQHWSAHRVRNNNATKRRLTAYTSTQSSEEASSWTSSSKRHCVFVKRSNTFSSSNSDTDQSRCSSPAGKSSSGMECEPKQATNKEMLTRMLAGFGGRGWL